jgi:hypothetical protein
MIVNLRTKEDGEIAMQEVSDTRDLPESFINQWDRELRHASRAACHLKNLLEQHSCSGPSGQPGYASDNLAVQLDAESLETFRMVAGALRRDLVRLHDAIDAFERSGGS